MKNLKIRTKLIASFTLTMAMMILLGVLALSSLSTVRFKAGEIADSWMAGLAMLSDTQKSMATLRRAEFNYLLYTDAASKAGSEKIGSDAINDAQAHMQEYIDMIEGAVYDNPADQEEDIKTLRSLDEKWKAYMDVSNQMIALDKAGNTPQAMQLLQGDSLKKFNELDAVLVDMIKFNIEGGKRDSEETEEIYNSKQTQMTALIIFSLVITIMATYMLVRNIERAIAELTRVSEAVGNGDLQVKAEIYSHDELGKLSEFYNMTIKNIRDLILSIQHNAEIVASSSEELTAGANQSAHVIQTVAENVSKISASADVQADKVEDTSSVVDHMAKGIEQASEAAVRASENAQSSIERAKEGVTAINKAIEQMEKIETTVSESAVVVETLGERSNEIGEIVGTISAISSQTNLLALNAAIEAARAGEQGRGFAVVAEEVRKLAEQSQEATEKIATLISNIQKETQKAVQTMNEGTAVVKVGTEVVKESGATFKDLSEITIQSAGQIKDISGTMKELAKNTEQIVASMSYVNNASKEIGSETQNAAAATQEQSATMEEIASSSQTLAHLAQEMQNATLKFTV